MRHAQSADKQPGQPDKDRELTPFGMQQSMQIGMHLKSEKILLDALYTSPAIRTQSTAQLISDTIKLESEKTLIEDELFEASVRTFLEFIHSLDDAYSNVMCVAHNPSISYLAEYLCKAEIGDMPPSALTVIKFSLPSWKGIAEGNGDLQLYLTPASLPHQ